MPIKAEVKKALFARSGNKCAFPECGVSLISEDGILFGDICHIEAIALGGPRYNSTQSDEGLSEGENLIALCPNHHLLVDSQPAIYTTEWLKRTKTLHEKKIEQAISESGLKKLDIAKVGLVTFADALRIWKENEDNRSEEFWQGFFEENPKIIAQAIPDQIVKLGQKAYLGGKNIENHGGNLIDFLYYTRTNKNVVLVEIKTPTTKLVGQQYRTNAYSLTEELSGAIVQVLNYRDELLKNYYNLLGQNPSLQFTAFNPRCLLIAGNLNIENPNAVQMKSFELFRSNSSNVMIVTFDELFQKVRDLIDIIS